MWKQSLMVHLLQVRQDFLQFLEVGCVGSKGDGGGYVFNGVVLCCGCGECVCAQ